MEDARRALVAAAPRSEPKRTEASRRHGQDGLRRKATSRAHAPVPACFRGGAGGEGVAGKGAAVGGRLARSQGELPPPLVDIDCHLLSLPRGRGEGQAQRSSLFKF